MSSTAKRKKNAFGVIFYQKKQTPRYYELDRKQMRILMVVLPSIAMISTVALAFGFLYFKQIRDKIRTTEPKIIEQLKQEKLALKQDLLATTALKEELQKKLTTAPTTSNIVTTDLIRPVRGQKDLTEFKYAQIEEDSLFKTENNKLGFRFRLTNTGKQDRISGYIFVIMRAGNHLEVHPPIESADDTGGMQFLFDQGESFTISRLRPVISEFVRPTNSDHVLFNVYVYSRSGDLIHREIFRKVIAE